MISKTHWNSIFCWIVRKSRHQEAAKEASSAREEAVFPSHIGLHSNIGWNCTNLYTKKKKNRREGGAGCALPGPAPAHPRPSGGFRSYPPVWGPRVLISFTVFSLSFRSVRPVSVRTSTAHLPQLGKSAGLVEICRGVGVWSTGNAWEIEISLRVYISFPAPAPPPSRAQTPSRPFAHLQHFNFFALLPRAMRITWRSMKLS